MPLESGYGPVLRQLRKAAHLSRVELAERSKVSDKTLARVEQEIGPPNLATLVSVLDALGVRLSDFAAALERGPSSLLAARGTPRSEWTAAMLHHGIDHRVLVGLAISCRTPADFADLVASAESAAAEIARGVVAEILAARERLQLVAEPESPYGEGERKR